MSLVRPCLTAQDITALRDARRRDWLLWSTIVILGAPALVGRVWLWFDQPESGASLMLASATSFVGMALWARHLASAADKLGLTCAEALDELRAANSQRASRSPAALPW